MNERSLFGQVSWLVDRRVSLAFPSALAGSGVNRNSHPRTVAGPLSTLTRFPILLPFDGRHPKTEARVEQKPGGGANEDFFQRRRGLEVQTDGVARQSAARHRDG